MRLLPILTCIIPALILTWLSPSCLVQSGLINRLMDKNKFIGYRPKGEKKGDHRLALLDTQNHKTWNFPINLWLHQYPRVKWIDGLHMHSYYAPDNVQKVFGFSKRSRLNAYYRAQEEPWYPHPDIRSFTMGQQILPEHDHVGSEEDTTLRNPLHWDLFESTKAPNSEYVYTSIFGRRRRRRRRRRSAQHKKYILH